MDDKDLMKVASVYNKLTEVTKVRSKDMIFLEELLEMIIYKVQIEKNIEWTPQNIKNFAIFLSEQKKIITVFSSETLISILDTALIITDNFVLSELATFVYASTELFPSSHLKL